MKLAYENIADKYPVIHRDLSWLSFNARVMQEANDKRNTLYERIKFLGIYSKNLGEFFHVRMPYHLNLVRLKKTTRKKLDYDPKKLIKEITQEVNRQQEEFTRIMQDEILPELAKEDIYVRDLHTISDSQRTYIHEYFLEKVRLYVDPVLMRGKSVNPFLRDGSLYLGILLKHKTSPLDNQEYGLVRIPSDVLPRFITLPSGCDINEVIVLDDVVRYGLPLLFSGYHILSAYSFKMTRDAELYIDSQYTGSLKEAIKKSLAKRQLGTPARFVFDRAMSEDLLTFLTDSFDLHKYDKIREGTYQNYYDLLVFPKFGKVHLQQAAWPPLTYQPFADNVDIWSAIKEKDQFIHPPYHDFTSLVQVFQCAATDPAVEEIFITQYRIGCNSGIMNAMILAAKNGKKVSVFLEVQARFDEQSNIEWGEKLEEAGVEVFYSISKVKVHCKVGLIKRKEGEQTQHYSVLSTGNFHEGNSKIYSDMVLVTAQKDICKELALLCDYLSNRSEHIPEYQCLLVGKKNLNKRLFQMIDREITHAQSGKRGYMILKMNSLEDQAIIQKLYEASQANVQVDLIVRGICCLIPQKQGLSENIHCVSIVDRYLEHARVYYFHNESEEELYLSSADWMTRNLHRRIEVALPIHDDSIKATILKTLHLQLADNVKARIIDESGNNAYHLSADAQVQSQVEIYQLLSESDHLVRPTKIRSRQTL